MPAMPVWSRPGAPTRRPYLWLLAAALMGSSGCATAEDLDEATLAQSHAQIDYSDEGSDGEVDDDSTDPPTTATQPSSGAPDDEFPTFEPGEFEENQPEPAIEEPDPVDEPSDPAPDDGSVTPPTEPLGPAPDSMTWEDCDPAFATHFCPELACETTSLCTDGQAQYEPDCRDWCTNILSCVTTRKSCIDSTDPLCIGEYFPRDKCIDYVDPQNEKSLGPSGASNYVDSHGNRAAVALLECACGG